ncbi:MAG: hypothetical protein COT85_04805 [Chlamydiae bacterium CG10_big_fil_rev_8_21_14_0_10_42_34]|nr:MAG: hypothetical protein COT85_04805 [Chlamydiae bacterium CG10_big_fil_rev_8_21_14_0_10_42_34]
MAEVTIRGNQFDAAPNGSYNKDFSTHLVDYEKTTYGAFRTLQFLDKTARLVAVSLKDTHRSLSASLEGIAGRLTSGWVVLSVPRLPEVTKKAWNAIFAQAPKVGNPQSTVDKVDALADCVGTWGYSSLLVKNNPAVKNLADVCSLVGDTIGLRAAGNELVLAKEYLNEVKRSDEKNEIVEQRFKDTATNALLKVVKSVTSVFTGVLGLLVLTFGGPVLPAFALISVGLAGTVASIASHFFKETREHQLVDFSALRYA